MSDRLQTSVDQVEAEPVATTSTASDRSDGPGEVKPLKNHRWQWYLGKKTLPSHRYKKMTIVEV